MAEPRQQPARQTRAAADEKKRINVHRFNLSGYIEVDAKDTKTIVKAADAVNAALKVLKDAGAVIQKDDAIFTSTTPGSTTDDDAE